MTSNEAILELRLTQLNNKIKLYSRIMRYPFFTRLLIKRYGKVIFKRDECFRTLRETLRKKYPDKFIRSGGSLTDSNA